MNDNNNNNNNIVSFNDFTTAFAKQNDLREKIAALKMQEDELNSKIASFERKILKNVQFVLKNIYSRLHCSYKVIHALAEYDKSGLFGYFFYLFDKIKDECPFDKFSISRSGEIVYFEYGNGKIVKLPATLMSDDYKGNLTNDIIALCSATANKFQEELLALEFR
jgi:hypothetical protein